VHHNSAHTPASMLKLHLFDQHKVISKPVRPFMFLLIALFVPAVASATALLLLAATSAIAHSHDSWQYPVQFVRQRLLAKLPCVIY